MSAIKTNQQTPFTAITCFSVENSRPRQLLLKASNMLPKDILDFFRKKSILFSGETEEDKAESMRFADVYQLHGFIVHLHSCIWNMTDDEIMYCILTQIAHCYLGSEPGFWSWNQNPDHPSPQETRAKELADKWIQNYFQKLFGVKHTIVMLKRSPPPPDTHPKDAYE